MIRALFAGIILTLPLIAGCASLDRDAQANSSTLTIQDAWVRDDVAGQNSAAYLQIVNEGTSEDQLIAARSDVAESTEIHHVVSHNHVMQMEEVDEIPVPGGETVILEPGGYHVMFFDLTRDLAAGDEVELTLIFAEAGEIAVTAVVREHTPGHGGG
jgi:periplasmic copper chaperone A